MVMEQAAPVAAVAGGSAPPANNKAEKEPAEPAKKKRKNTSLGKNLKRKWENKTDDCTTSRYRGVTKHRRSGRWESHIWVSAKGKQIYLGGYELEEHAASAYDVARLKIKGKAAKTNFPVEKYDKVLVYLEQLTFDDLVMAVRKQSQGFAKSPAGMKWASKHSSGKWEAKALVGSGSKSIHLGYFDSEQEALAAHRRAVAKMSGDFARAKSGAPTISSATQPGKQAALASGHQIAQREPELGMTDLQSYEMRLYGKMGLGISNLPSMKSANANQLSNPTLGATLASMMQHPEQKAQSLAPPEYNSLARNALSTPQLPAGAGSVPQSKLSEANSVVAMQQQQLQALASLQGNQRIINHFSGNNLNANPEV